MPEPKMERDPTAWRRARIAAGLLAILACACATPPPLRGPAGFERLPTGSRASLRGIAVVDAQCVVVGGSDGTLLRTDDGGLSWRSIAPADGERCDFRDVEALDRERLVAMVAGQPARVYRSDDGGWTWRIVHADADPAAFFDAIAFAGERGVVFGDPVGGAFALAASDDGGRSWGPAPPGTLLAPEPGEAAFAASGRCLVAAGGGVDRAFALVTGGGACRWFAFEPGRPPRARTLPLACGTPSRGAFALAVDGPRLVAVGGDYAAPSRREGTAAWSDDGGATWHAADALGYRSAVLWLDARRLVAVGSHGASWSADGGRTWRPLGDEGWHALARGADGSVFACGSDGRVGRLVW